MPVIQYPVPALIFNEKQLSNFDLNKITTIVIHHTANSIWTIQDVHKYQKDTLGWAGIAYHFFINKDGTAYYGRPINKIGAGVSGNNSYTIHICLQGNFQDGKNDDGSPETPTTLQMASLEFVISFIRQQFPEKNLVVKGHRDVGLGNAGASLCPGDNFYKLSGYNYNNIFGNPLTDPNTSYVPPTNTPNNGYSVSSQGNSQDWPQIIIRKAREYLGQNGKTVVNMDSNWCVAFVSKVFQDCNASAAFNDGKWSKSCYEVQRWADDNNLNVKNAQPGDLIIRSKNEHISIVIENREDEYYCIDGNWSNKVSETHRKKASYNVQSIIRPPWYKIEGDYPYWDEEDWNGNYLSSAQQADLHIGRRIKHWNKEHSYKPYDFDGSKNPEYKNNNTNHKSENIQNLNTNIGYVNDYLKNKHDMTSFIKFSIGDKNNPSFSLNTADLDSFNHYAISLENQKTGVGKGNQFKLKIAYHKHFSNYQDINKLEAALAGVKKNSLMREEFSGAKNIKKNQCYLQYGYLVNNNRLQSPEYIGTILKYTVTANQQIVQYTLEGFSGEQTSSSNVVNWYPNVVGSDSVGTLLGKTRRAVMTLRDKASSNQLAEDAVEDFINDLDKQYSGGITFNPFFLLDIFFQDYNQNVAAEGGSKYYLLDCTGKSEHLGSVDVLEPVHAVLCKGQTPLQYAEYLISLFKYKTDNFAIKYLQQEGITSDRFVYSVKNDIENNKIYVCVDVIQDDTSDSKVAYDFTGYSTNNALLIDYNLNYDGTVALSVSEQEETSKNQDNAIYVDKSGLLRVRTSLTRDLFVSGEISEVLIAKQNTWLDKISVANSCTLTTFGLPFEISIGTIFKCGVYITDTLHHTSGNCYVTSIVDKINNSKFTTDFTLIRLPGRNTKLTSDI